MATQDPMDAALYYLALRKKNVLTHLFKTAKETEKSNFFRENFEVDTVLTFPHFQYFQCSWILGREMEENGSKNCLRTDE